MEKKCCDNKYSADAIAYENEDTIALSNERKEKNISSINYDYEMMISIDYLYLDLTNCKRCVGTDSVLDEVIEVLTPALNLADFDIKYEKIEMTTPDIAKKYRFLSSPTIRVNGKDLFNSITENNCQCCSDISGNDVDCRVFEYDGHSYEIPPKAMLTREILKAIFTQNENYDSENYQLPYNLKQFYNGKENQNTCSPGCNCK